MSLEMTLALMALSCTGIAVSIWRVRHPPEPGTPRLIDWHFVLFPSIVLTALLCLHLSQLVLGKS